MVASRDCPIQRSLAIVGRRGAFLVLRDLLDGTRRFSELQASTGLSPNTLTERLKELEAEGILSRVVYPEVPPRVEYSLTEKGRALAPVLEALKAWGERWAGPVPPLQPASPRLTPRC